MKFKRILSMLLAVVTVCGCMVMMPVGIGTVSAASTANTSPLSYSEETARALTKAFANAEDMLKGYTDVVTLQSMPAYMQLRIRAQGAGYGYELYCNDKTGEVAYRNMITGQVIASNPYNLSGISSAITKGNLLSQLEIEFTDSENNTKKWNSFEQAAQRGQIKVEDIKNGLRVEYIMGRLDTSYLLPVYIEKSRFETLIKAPMQEYLDSLEEGSEAWDLMKFYMDKFLANYSLIDPLDPNNHPDTVASMYEKFPVLAEAGSPVKSMYVLAECTDREKQRLEGNIKEYCPNYTEEELATDNEMTKAPKDLADTPVFRMAIEYVLEEDGLAIRMPASSIRFDETKYTLSYVRMLQFFGAGNLQNKGGYLFYPDGSGSLVEFEDFYKTPSNNSPVSLYGFVYGDDYAYYDISGAKHQETIRMPVFGVVDPVKKANGTTVSQGFVAVLEEGASLAQISASFGASAHNYGSVYTTFYPRPTDTYNMKDVISVGDNTDWTVVSEKKYTGDYRLKVAMLTDPALGDAKMEEGKLTDYYETSYVGMAKFYQDYLVKQGILQELKESEIQEQIPLYIESFGSFESVVRVLSIPITVDAPLTTFADITAMYDELSSSFLSVQDIYDTDEDNDKTEAIKVENTAENREKYAGYIRANNTGIKNINFRLTGFANGGMEATYPAKLKWVGALGGAGGFQDLLDDANKRGYGVYPEFDFMYISETSMFDGVSTRNDVSRAVDDRYCSKQLYDALYQEFVSYFDLVTTPSSVKKYAEKFSKFYKNENIIGISVSTMGSDLNSDFNTENLYNRDDAQKAITSSLATLQNDFGSVMLNGGNAYALQYTDHLLEAALDSSRFAYNSHTVPFVGMVLHGYLNYAGYAINESGSGEYELLRAIESGAALYYKLSYQDENIIKIKEDFKLSQNYSIRYSIWRDSLVEQYHLLNNAIGDLQDYKIVGHTFLIGERVPDASELLQDAQIMEDAIYAALDAAHANAKSKMLHEMNVRQIAAEYIANGVATDAASLIKLVEDRMYGNGSLSKFDGSPERINAIITEMWNNQDKVGCGYGKQVFVTLDREAILASIAKEVKLVSSSGAITTIDLTLTDAQIAVVDAYIAKLNADNAAAMAKLDEANIVMVEASKATLELQKDAYPVTNSTAMDGAAYDTTKYTENRGGIVMVTYQKGTDEVRFILNYNTFQVVVQLEEGADPIVIDSYDFVRLDNN